MGDCPHRELLSESRGTKKRECDQASEKESIFQDADIIRTMNPVCLEEAVPSRESGRKVSPVRRSTAERYAGGSTPQGKALTQCEGFPLMSDDYLCRHCDRSLQRGIYPRQGDKAPRLAVRTRVHDWSISPESSCARQRPHEFSERPDRVRRATSLRRM